MRGREGGSVVLFTSTINTIAHRLMRRSGGSARERRGDPVEEHGG